MDTTAAAVVQQSAAKVIKAFAACTCGELERNREAHFGLGLKAIARKHG